MAHDKTDLIELDISHEMWREYEWVNPDNAAELRCYRIAEPETLFLRPGGTTHRVSDVAGITHCIPAVGRFGCVLRWENKPEFSRCEF